MYNCLPPVLLMRFANKHNDDNSFRLKRTLFQCIDKLRDFWLHHKRTWTLEVRTLALEALGYKSPTAKDAKSQNEYFQLASVSDELWVLIKAMLQGEYTSYNKKNRVCVHTYSLVFIIFNYIIQKPRGGKQSISKEDSDDSSTEQCEVSIADAGKSQLEGEPQKISKRGKLPNIENTTLLRPLIKINNQEAIRLATAFVHGLMSSQQMALESNKIQILKVIRKEFVTKLNCDSWEHAQKKYPVSSSEVSLMLWGDAFLVYYNYIIIIFKCFYLYLCRLLRKKNMEIQGVASFLLQKIFLLGVTI